MARSVSAPAQADAAVHAAPLGVIANLPNPARLYKSLRDSGYSNDAAVGDLVDNAIDAGATHVSIFIEPETGRLEPFESRVIVADDGSGMPLSVLREALKLGSDTPHDLTSDLGKYGMGLITASISMGRTLKVLTKTSGGELLRAIHDLGLIESRNEFLAEISGASKEDRLLWEKYSVSRDHGTVVIVEDCDQLSYASSGGFINHLKKRLGQVFRLFIIAKSAPPDGGDLKSFLTINGAPVYAVDPLMLEENKGFAFPKTLDLLQDSAADLVDDFAITVDTQGNEPMLTVDTIRVRIVALPELGLGLSQQLGINATNSGFYVMRNQREIAAAQTLGIFSKAQALTGFRAELHIPATLDKRMRINWTKQRVDPDDSLQELLRRRIGPHVATVRKRYHKSTAEKTPLDHKAYEALISKKAKLLTFPKVRSVEHERTRSVDGTVTPKETDVIRSGNGKYTDRVRERCHFQESHMTASGPLWEPEMEGSKVVVTFNVDHPLWTRFVVEGSSADSDQSAVTELLHLFSFCLTTAEFGVFSEEADYERLVNMRQQLSNNMRVLLT